MNDAVLRGLLAAGLLAAAGCAALTPVPVAVHRGQSFVHADGESALFHTIDLGTAGPDEVPQTRVFVVPGSDCRSMGAWLPDYFRGLESEAGAIRIEILHKRHVADGDIPAPCSEAFARADHPRRWLADQTAFITSRLGTQSPHRLVLVGISEGGEVVPALARLLEGVTHLVLLASGGMEPLEAFALQVRRHGIEGADAVLDAAAAPAPIDADAPSEALGGRSWRYWSELRELRPTDHLLALAIPVFIAMGEQDRSMPPEAATRLAARFTSLGKSNLTVRFYPQADHALFDRAAQRSRLPEFWRDVGRWLTR